jgi:hypothetical protein
MQVISYIGGACFLGLLGLGGLVLTAPASRLDVQPEPACALQEALDAQTVLLTQIAAVLERWDASEQQARDESASRRTRVLHGWGQGQGTQGMRELPTTLGR